MSRTGFVLAAGFGSRIGALSTHRPKPLLPVRNSTPFARAVRELRTAGCNQIVANASHLGEQVVAAGERLDVSVIVEPGHPRGTAGGLHGILPLADGALIGVYNGDILADVPVGALFDLVESRPDISACLAVRKVSPKGIGNVGIAADGRVVRLRSQVFPKLPVETQSAFFCAIHVMSRRLAETAPVEGCLISDVYLPALDRGERLQAIETPSTYFHDIGDLPSYLAANLDGPEPNILGSGVQVDAGVQLDRAVCGDNVRVDGSGTISQVVAWNDLTFSAPIFRAVVISTGVIIPVSSE